MTITYGMDNARLAELRRIFDGARVRVRIGAVSTHEAPAPRPRKPPRKQHARVQPRAASTSAAKRTLYVEGPPPKERRVQARAAADPHFAELDRAWGLGPKASAVTRTSHQLSASVLGSPETARPTPRPAPRPAPPAPGGTLPRPAGSRERAEWQREMDARMGTASPSNRVRREGSSLVFTHLAPST